MANDDRAVIPTSGFTVNRTNRASAPLPKPSVENFDNLASTQLMVHLTPIDHTRACKVRINPGTNNWQPHHSPPGGVAEPLRPAPPTSSRPAP